MYSVNSVLNIFDLSGPVIKVKGVTGPKQL